MRALPTARIVVLALPLLTLVVWGGCSRQDEASAPQQERPSDAKAAIEPESNAAPRTPDDTTVVAMVGDREITTQEVDERIREQLFERMIASQGPVKLKQHRDRALEDMIDELVLAREARRRGLTPEELLEGERRAVRDEQVEIFFEQHRAQFGEDADLGERFGEIRQLLLEKRKQEVLSALRAREDLEVRTPRPGGSIDRGGFAIGPASAPVTLVAFVDYTSTSYRRTQPVLDALAVQYPNRLRMQMRQLPDARHPRARAASTAALCAEEQGRFPAYHQRLLENPRELADEDLERYAMEAGMDLGSFGACTNSSATEARIDQDIQAARAVGIEVSPGFWLNGQVVPGPRPVSIFTRMIDAHLQRAQQAGLTGEGW